MLKATATFAVAGMTVEMLRPDSCAFGHQPEAMYLRPAELNPNPPADIARTADGSSWLSRSFTRIADGLSTHAAVMQGRPEMPHVQISPLDAAEMIRGDHLAILVPRMGTEATADPRPLDGTAAAPEMPSEKAELATWRAEAVRRHLEREMAPLSAADAISRILDIRMLNNKDLQSGELNAMEYLAIERYDEIVKNYFEASKLYELHGFTDHPLTDRKLLDVETKLQYKFNRIEELVAAERDMQLNADVSFDNAKPMDELDIEAARRRRKAQLKQAIHVMLSDLEAEKVHDAIKEYKANAVNWQASPSFAGVHGGTVHATASLLAEMDPHDTSFAFGALPVQDQRAVKDALTVLATGDHHLNAKSVRQTFATLWQDLPSRLIYARAQAVDDVIGSAIAQGRTAATFRSSEHMQPESTSAAAHASLQIIMKDLEQTHRASQPEAVFHLVR